MRELLRSSWLIAAAVIIPLMMFVALQSGFGAREERRSTEEKSLATAEAIVVGSDAVLARSIGAIEALSTIQALPVGDVPGAYRRAREIASLNPDWVTVQLSQVRDGTILFDLRRPLGAGVLASAPKPAPRATLIGDVVRDGAGCPCVALERTAPGPGGGYVITVLMALDPFKKLMPSTARYEVSALVTREGKFIVRTMDQVHRVGKPGSKYLEAAVAGGKQHGIYRGFTLEGFENYTAFARSALSGWSAHVAMGTQNLDTPARRFLSSLGLAAFLSLLLAGVLIWFALRQIAEGRRAAERGQQAQKLEALGQLTGGIAHDFNNLLTPVVGALDFLLKRGALDVRAKRIAGGALASAERAAKLTAQLLAFSRRQKLAIEPVDVTELVANIQPMLVQSLGKDHEVETVVAPGGHVVRSDANQLELALLNLVINARDATPGGGTITIAVDSERDQVVLRVTDQGEGMTSETRARAVEPFFTTTPQGRGTGLGLAQVFGLVQQSGVSVDIECAAGRGTTVTLRLPSCHDVPKPRHGTVVEPSKKARPLRLLLVDDDAAVRATIARNFEDDGHIVDSVGDGRVALKAIEHCRYDLVIVDFAMPLMDGAEVIREGRKLRPEIKFLMVTGYSDSEAVTGACPDTPVIRKPFESEALRQTVFDLVG
jgi:signal transduction histidine kinase/CheY-like chemotaxis protein